MIRKGKNVYSEKYQEAIDLYDKGADIKEISQRLGISYSAVYNWVKGKRKPEKSQLNRFIEFLEKNGPTPVILLKEMFPSHDDFYKTLSERGFKVRRYSTSRKKGIGDASVWYFIEGQEVELKKRIIDMLENYRILKERFAQK